MENLKCFMGRVSILSQAKLYYEENLSGPDNLNKKCWDIWKTRHLFFMLNIYNNWKGFQIDFSLDKNVYKVVKQDLLESSFEILKSKAFINKIIELKENIEDVNVRHDRDYLNIKHQVYSDFDKEYKDIKDHLFKLQKDYYDKLDEKTIKLICGHTKSNSSYFEERAMIKHPEFSNLIEKAMIKHPQSDSIKKTKYLLENRDYIKHENISLLKGINLSEKFAKQKFNVKYYKDFNNIF